MAQLFQQGAALHQQGQLAQAKQIYEQVLAREPAHVDALHMLGVIAAQAGHPAVAVALIGKAIAIDPTHAAAHSNLGNALLALKRPHEALASYDKALALRPDYAQAHSNRGSALHALEQVAQALASHDRALALQPGYAEAHANRGGALHALQRPQEALASCDRAIALKPDHAPAHYNRANALRALQRPQEALASYDRAIALNRNDAQAHYNRGNALQDLQRFEDAIASYDQAIAASPAQAAAAYANRGTALQELRRVEEALASYDKAIALDPNHAEAQWNKSLLLLLAGDLVRGWALYEWRWRNDKLGFQPRTFQQPLWLGQDSIQGKTILLHAEQGLGDTIQFCRYAPLVKALGATVILEVPQVLLSLLASLPGVDALIAQGQPLPVTDFHCPLLSLPLAFRTDLVSIPHPQPYLAAAPRKLEAWAQRLGPKSRPRVGLVWSGSTAHHNDHNRSLQLQALLPHLPAHCEYVSLQKDVRDIDRPALEASGIRHDGDALQDFSDTAALCALMDLVVSVDTSVAHLAGAIGQRTCVLLPHVPDWRWLLDRDDSPWYASVTLYRQAQRGDWRTVLVRLRSALDALHGGADVHAVHGAGTEAL